jgi:hypothetical protein
MDTPNALEPVATSPAKPVPDIVQRYLDGESLNDIAATERKSHQAIYKFLLKECGPEWDEMVTDALISRIADADTELMNAADKVAVARAREIARFARMDFERRRPKLYGPKQELNIDEKVTVIIQRGPVTPPVVDQSRIISVNSEVIDKTENSKP